MCRQCTKTISKFNIKANILRTKNFIKNFDFYSAEIIGARNANSNYLSFFGSHDEVTGNLQPYSLLGALFYQV